MKDKEIDEELEDGEIRESDFEDISDCSLSEMVTVSEDLNDESDVDLLREEALKSMQNNDENEAIDDIPEEEKYRLEALKSLLKNIELSEKDDVKPENEPKKRKTKRKRKHSSKHRGKRRKKSPAQSDDIQPSEISVEMQKTDNSTVCHLQKGSKNDEEDRAARSWYPKHEFALIDISCKENIDSQTGSIKPERSEDFVPLTMNSDEKVPMKLAKFSLVNLPSRPASAVVNKVNSVPLSAVANKVNPVPLSAVANKVNPVPLTKSTTFRKVSKHHIRKIGSSLPVASIFPTANVKADKYKLVNKSNNVLRGLSVPKANVIRNKPAKSKYSINRLKCEFPRINPKEFIIDLDEEDSSKEDDGPESICGSNASRSPEACSRVSSTSNVTEPKEEKVKLLPPNEERVEIPLSDAKVHSSKNCPAVSVSTVEASNVETSDMKSSCSVDGSEKDNGDGMALPKDSNDSSLTCDVKSCSVYESEKEDRDCVALPKDSNDLPFIRSASDTTDGAVTNQNDGLPEKKSSEDGTKPLGTKVRHNGEKENVIEAKKDYPSILVDAEANLIKIREKLVSDLDQLDQITKQHILEYKKLQSMLKKLLLLKSMVLKIEDKIKWQKSRLSTNANCMDSLFRGVSARIENCSKMKEICLSAGRNLVGPSYKPPDDFEDLIMEKQKGIDVSKFAPRDAK